MIDYSEEDLLRYSRHILLQEVGVEGQERIRQGKVLIVGLFGSSRCRHHWLGGW